jgi:hypothetical protein
MLKFTFPMRVQEVVRLAQRATVVRAIRYYSLI